MHTGTIKGYLKFSPAKLSVLGVQRHVHVASAVKMCPQIRQYSFNAHAFVDCLARPDIE